jgi:hypothetical protein
VVDEPAGQGDEPGAHGTGDGELIAGAGAAELVGPAGEFVGEHGAGQPGSVGDLLHAIDRIKTQLQPPLTVPIQPAIHPGL